MTQPPSPPIPVRLSIGVTGHRDLRPEQESALRARVRGLFERLEQEFPDLPLQVISALAEGADQWVAEEALALGIPVLAPLPMAQAEYERDFSNPEALARFRALLAHCHTQTLPLAPGSDDAAVDHAGPGRDRQYAQVGAFISSHCQILLALWDGAPTEAGGGTADVVHFHRHERMPAQGWSAPAARQPLEHGDDLVYHLPCARRGAAGAQAEAGDGPARWLTAQGEWPGDGPMPRGYRNMFALMQTCNRDLTRHSARIAVESGGLLPAEAPAPVTATMRRLDALYRQSDWLALHFQRWHWRLLFGTHALAIVLGLCFILYYNLAPDPLVLAAFVLGLSLGALWYRFGQRRDWHRKYHHYRVLAEGLRVQFYWHLSGIPPDAGIHFAHRGFLRSADRELGWIRQVMRGAALPDDRLSAPDPEWLSWSIDDWIGRVDGSTGQLAYYRGKLLRSFASDRRSARLIGAALFAGFGLAAALLILRGRLQLTTASYLLALVGLLPLIAGVHEASAERQADRRQTRQYRLMLDLLRRAREQLDAAAGDGQRREVLKTLGEACLHEHSRWLLAHHRPAQDESNRSGRPALRSADRRS